MGTKFAEEAGALQGPTGVRHELARSGTPAEVDAALQQGDDKLFEMFMLGSSVDTADADGREVVSTSAMKTSQTRS